MLDIVRVVTDDPHRDQPNVIIALGHGYSSERMRVALGFIEPGRDYCRTSATDLRLRLGSIALGYTGQRARRKTERQSRRA